MCYNIGNGGDTLNQRIKKVRMKVDLTQNAFGEVLGISRAAVQKLESGENNPSEQTIRAICEKFGVNRQWLETGDESIQPYEREPDLETEVRSLLKNEPPVKQAVMISLASMPDEWWDAWAQKLYEEVEKHQKKKGG